MSKEPTKSREEIKAAREAKKLAKLKVKIKNSPDNVVQKKDSQVSTSNIVENTMPEKSKEMLVLNKSKLHTKSTFKDKDEVDRAISSEVSIGMSTADKNREQKMINNQSKSKENTEDGEKVNLTQIKNITNKSVSETMDKIADAAKEVKELAARLDAIKVDESTAKEIKEESGKSKAELKAERRAKQEAQRAAKLGAINKEKNASVKLSEKKPIDGQIKTEKKTLKAKISEKAVKVKSINKQELLQVKKNTSLLNIGINNPNVHPAIVKLGVQLATGTVRGSNARSVALLSALKQVVRDYSLPAETEFARGLEATLSSNLEFLWGMRPPATTQTNAIKYFRYQLTQLPNNVNEFDAKETLQEAIDTYIREQIDMAGQAISLSVRKKISSGDCILTFGWSSLVERILLEAWRAGVRYRALVVGGRGGRELSRRLSVHRVPVVFVHVDAVHEVMPEVDKVILGACALLVNGWVVTTAGSAAVSRAARAHNVPVLVCAERHKVSERVHTDPFFCDQLGNPDEMLDDSDENPSGSKNLLYDVTPPSLVTAVVTELAILPCSSAPVVLRFMLSEYGF